MYKIIAIIFGEVFANKLKIQVGETKRNPSTQIAFDIVEKYKKIFRTGNQYEKTALVAIPFFNLFIFQGFFTMLFILFLDYCLVRYILNRK